MVYTFHGIVMAFKKALSSLWLSILIIFGIGPTSICEGRAIITNPQGVFEAHRSGYYKYVDYVRNRVKGLKGSTTFFGSWITEKGAAAFGYSAQQVKNANIIWRFFKSDRYMQFSSAIGSAADFAYMSSVFKELYSGRDHSFEKLIEIMHHHMMDALGFPQSTSINQFIKIVEQKDKKGNYVNIHGQQFEIYCRMIALNLFISYCHQNRVGL